MASIQSLRGEALPAEGAANDPAPSTSGVRAWLAGRRPEDRPVDLLAFALASERDLPGTGETMALMREKASVALAEYAVRHLHNHVQEIRQQAVLEQLGRARPPAGFVKLLLANLTALTLAGGIAGWLYAHPHSWLLQTMAELVGLIPG